MGCVLGALALLVVVVAAQGVAFYFGPFAAHANQVLGAGPNLWGRVAAAQPRGTLVLSIGGESPMVNAGWVVLLAPDARRGEVKDPGFLLPFATPDRTPLAFVLGDEQADYIPYLRAIYPRGSARMSVGADGSFSLSVYSVPAPTGRALFSRRGIPNSAETPAGTVRLLAPGEGLRVSVRVSVSTPQVQGASWPDRHDRDLLHTRRDERHRPLHGHLDGLGARPTHGRLRLHRGGARSRGLCYRRACPSNMATCGPILVPPSRGCGCACPTACIDCDSSTP